MIEFVHPSWITGLLYYLIPMLIFGIIFVIGVFGGLLKDSNVMIVIGFIALGGLLLSPVMCDIGWHYQYEVPSVNEKVITVDSWQPKAGLWSEDGMMVIDNADQLMLITNESEGFLNEENFLFQKFDTRDILNELKPNGTYKIKYYGWREGFNSGFPNILSIEEVIDENNTGDVKYSDYFGTKVI